MSDYSSDEESVNQGKFRTYLGFVDVPISSEELPTIEDSFIGASPLWIDDIVPPTSLLKCDNCSESMALLTQTFSPLPGSANDRVLYLFGCQNYKCNRKKGSIKCIKGIKFRNVKLSFEEQMEQQQEKQYKLKLKDGLFGKKTDSSNSNPFASSNPFATSSDNPFTVKKEEIPKYSEIVSKTIEKKEIVETKPKIKDDLEIKLKKYPGFILYIEKERVGNDDDVLPPIPKDIQIEETDDIDLEKLNFENKTSKKIESFKSDVLNDPQFQSFSQRVAHNPRQVLRYELSGSPLIYSSKDQKSLKAIPAPSWHKDSARQFEFQLMPKAIMDLESSGNFSVAESMEWGTILVFTDVEDYIPKDKMIQEDLGYVEEYVVVEWEEPMDYSKIK